ncbi:recombinase family protein [Rothia terrae]|uniref:Recombinase family protein n=1 Tax=Rothia terrae TaxID=396015 RepID=A0A7S7B042_9MICC|nr:recombinase family protein [Rothia terrae]QOW64749.1 recombinase family protein [Rothia terrae]
MLSIKIPQDAFIFTILGTVAEFEWVTMRERQAEGIALARERGVYSKFRILKLSTEQIEWA